MPPQRSREALRTHGASLRPPIGTVNSLEAEDHVRFGSKLGRAGEHDRSSPKSGSRSASLLCRGSATNGHSRNSEAPLTPRKPSEFPCTSVRASSASQRARLRKKLRPYNAAEPRKSDRFPGVP